MLQKDKHHIDKLKVFNCLYTNADSLPNKLDELKARIQYCEGSMDIIGITEINPKNCRYYPGKAELQIDGYDLFMDENNEVKKRGVGLYIRRELKAEEVKINTKFQESMWVTVKLNNKDKIIIGCIYKSPNSS